MKSWGRNPQTIQEYPKHLGVGNPQKSKKVRPSSHLTHTPHSRGVWGPQISRGQAAALPRRLTEVGGLLVLLDLHAFRRGRDHAELLLAHARVRLARWVAQPLLNVRQCCDDEDEDDDDDDLNIYIYI